MCKVGNIILCTFWGKLKTWVLVIRIDFRIIQKPFNETRWHEKLCIKIIHISNEISK